MTDDLQDIDLNALSDDELVEQMHNDLYDGMRDEIVEGTNILLGRGFTATQVLDDALVAGMKIVGIDFRDGILFVPEVLLAANAMKAGMEILRPLLAETGAEPVGKVVIGTVKGDIHDIGKNLVGMMLEGAGFEVIDLGINTDADKFINALDEHKPDILGMSALLTTTMPYMKVVIQTLKDREPARRLHRPRRRRAAQRGVRHGRRCRRLLSRRGRRRGDGPSAHRRAPCPRRLRPTPPIPSRPAARRHHRLRRARPRAAGPDPRRARGQGPGRRRAAPHAAGAHRRRRRGADPRGPCPLGRRHPDVRRRTPTAARPGSLDAVLEREGVERIEGAHCYEFYAGAAAFAALQEEELGTFYLTDFLARQFESIVWAGLGLDVHPELAADVLRCTTGGSSISPRPTTRT